MDIEKQEETVILNN